MTFHSLSMFVACALFVLGGDPSFAQSSSAKDKLAEQAQQEYGAKKFAEAERDFRELTVRHPSNIYMQICFGQTLFEQQKFAESLRPFEKALDLERSGSKLTPDQHRILVDQLVMAYGISGDLKKARVLVEGAIRISSTSQHDWQRLPIPEVSVRNN
jgi:predicted Zn-dependent protease